MKNKKGFTLVELLAVMVILGILIAIAVPSVIAISDRIKSNMYESKLKTISAAVSVWVDDHKKQCPSQINSLTVGQLVDNKYIKYDDDKTKDVLDNNGQSMLNKKVKDLTYLDNTKVIDANNICPDLP